jgi:hypothetical protein
MKKHCLFGFQLVSLSQQITERYGDVTPGVGRYEWARCWYAPDGSRVTQSAGTQVVSGDEVLRVDVCPTLNHQDVNVLVRCGAIITGGVVMRPDEASERIHDLCLRAETSQLTGCFEAGPSTVELFLRSLGTIPRVEQHSHAYGSMQALCRAGGILLDKLRHAPDAEDSESRDNNESAVSA